MKYFEGYFCGDVVPVRQEYPIRPGSSKTVPCRRDRQLSRMLASFVNKTKKLRFCMTQYNVGNIGVVLYTPELTTVDQVAKSKVITPRQRGLRKGRLGSLHQLSIDIYVHLFIKERDETFDVR